MNLCDFFSWNEKDGIIFPCKQGFPGEADIWMKTLFSQNPYFLWKNSFDWKHPTTSLPCCYIRAAVTELLQLQFTFLVTYITQPGFPFQTLPFCNPCCSSSKAGTYFFFARGLIRHDLSLFHITRAGNNATGLHSFRFHPDGFHKLVWKICRSQDSSYLTSWIEI